MLYKSSICIMTKIYYLFPKSQLANGNNGQYKYVHLYFNIHNYCRFCHLNWHCEFQPQTVYVVIHRVYIHFKWQWFFVTSHMRIRSFINHMYFSKGRFCHDRNHFPVFFAMSDRACGAHLY